MKKYTIRRHRRRRQTRSKKYLKTRRQRSRYGGVSKRPSATPSGKPSLGIRQSSSRSTKPTGGVVVLKDGVPVSQSRGRTPSRAPSRAPPKTSLRNAGISKKEIKDDTQALEAAKLIAEFPLKMDKFLQMVINNYELLNYEGVKFALRQQISINKDPAVGRLSTNGIIFISYICGKLVCLLNELSRLPNSEVDKKSELLREIKKIEQVYGVGLFDRTQLAFIIKDKVELLPITQFDYALEKNFLTKDTLYFNNTVGHLAEFENNWIIPIEKSWLQKKIKNR